MFVVFAVVIVYVRRADKLETARYPLEMPVSAIVTNSDIRQLGHAPEFLNAFDRGDFIRDIFDHQIDSGKFTDLKNRSVGVLKRYRVEGVSGVAEVHHHILRPDA